MAEVVGAPVLVKDDDPHAVTTKLQLSSCMRSVNRFCCIGSTLLMLQVVAVLQLLQVVAVLQYGFAFVSSSESSLHSEAMHKALSGLALFSGVLSIAGLCLLSRAQRIPGGCECLSCSGPYIPWSLLAFSGGSMLLNFINAVQDAVHGGDQDNEWSSSIVINSLATLSACTAFGFSFHWSRRAAQQSFTDLQSSRGCVDGKDEVQSQGEGHSAQARFAELDSRESKGFEAAYVFAEAVFFVVSLIYWSVEALSKRNTEEFVYLLKANSVILLMCFFFRTYRLVFAAPGERISVLATVFDAFEFSWHGFAIAITGEGVGGTFLLNILLSYMLLFVFPFRRALLVVPLCYISYVCSARSLSDIYLEGTLLGLGLCLNMFAKRMMQDSKWQTFLLIQEKTELAIQEKVLRFQAEFSSEVVARSLVKQEQDDQTSYMHDAQSHQPTAIQCNSVHMTQANGNACDGVAHLKVMPYASSISSAPALLTHGLEDLPEMDAANCLPLDALAWIEGEARPKPLAELQPGSRILCYDRLGGSLKHATLLDVQRKDGPVEWTIVTLADGATLEMTSDHPMQPMDLDQSEEADHISAKAFLSRPGLPVRAADLKPGKHSLVFMQVVPSMVQSVTSFLESKARMALTIQQPERHALFVASPGSHNNGTVQTMAVESVNVSASSCVQIGHRQSFLTVAHPCDQEDSEVKAASAPPSLHGPGHVKSHIASEDSDSVYNSSSGFSSADPGDLLFGPLPVMTSNSNASDNGRNATREKPHYKLTEILQLKAAGLKSRGSVYHIDGQCRLCAHENKNQFYNSPPCFKGMFCERCHEVHANDVKDHKRRQQRIRRRMREAALKCQPPNCEADTPLDVSEGDAETGHASAVTCI